MKRRKGHWALLLLWAGLVLAAGCTSPAAETAVPTASLSPSDQAALEMARGTDSPGDTAAPAPAPETEPSVTLTLAVGGGTTLDTSVFADFAADNPGCTVETVDYLARADYDAGRALSLLLTDIAGGNGPDVVDLLSFGLDPVVYGEKGLFENLSPWLAADETLSDAGFVESVFSLCGSEGRLYAIMSGFSVKTLLAPASLAAALDTWDLEAFFPYSNALGGATLDPERAAAMSGEDFLDTLCETSVLSFVDYGAGQAYFDSAAFIALLECCAGMEAAPLQSPALHVVSIWDFFELQYAEAVMGEEVVFLGIPGRLDGSAGAYVNNQNNFLAMNALSENKELAWDFMRRYLTEDYQTAAYVGRIHANAFPTNQAVLASQIAQAQSVLYTTDIDGNEAELTQRGQYDYVYTPATDAHIEKVLSLIDSAAAMQGYDAALAAIIQEEAAAFFAGDRSAGETAALIQNRASLYLAEQK